MKKLINSVVTVCMLGAGVVYLTVWATGFLVKHGRNIDLNS